MIYLDIFIKEIFCIFYNTWSHRKKYWPSIDSAIIRWCNYRETFAFAKFHISKVLFYKPIGFFLAGFSSFSSDEFLQLSNLYYPNSE